jgi:hypothetical protein
VLERVENIVDRSRRVLPCVGHTLDLGVDSLLVQVDQVDHEVVRTSGLNVPGCQHSLREVLRVVSDDEPGIGLDRRGENMPIVGVGEFQDLHQWLITGDQNVADRSIHQTSGAIELCWIQFRPVGLEVAERFVKDPIGPLRLDETSLRDADEQVAQAVGVEDVRVVDNDESPLSKDPSRG